MLVFEERGKPEYPRKTSRSRVENEQQTQPTYDVGSGNHNMDVRYKRCTYGNGATLFSRCLLSWLTRSASDVRARADNQNLLH